MGIQHRIRQFLWKFGYDISRFTPEFHPLARRKQILRSYKIDTVLDIGANTGQFAQQLRQDLGYTHRIMSMEPLSAAFKLLQASAKGDPAWQTFHCALGESAEKREINIAGNSYSSSLLEMLPSHLKSAPDSRYIGKEMIEIKPLDSLFGDLCQTAKNVYMKIDTQGYEVQVLRGAVQSLPRIGTVQREMSLIPLYKRSKKGNEKRRVKRKVSDWRRNCFRPRNFHGTPYFTKMPVQRIHGEHPQKRWIFTSSSHGGGEMLCTRGWVGPVAAKHSAKALRANAFQRKSALQ